LNEATLQDLDEAINEFQEDEEVRVLIITGGGEKAFSAGADLKEFGISFQPVFNRVERCKKPVIAAINGYALGGGCELAMACHFRIMAENATIGLTEINRSLIPGGGGTQRMPRLIGRAKALELLLLGEKLEADEALDIGLVNEVSKDGELMKDAKEFAKRLAKQAPISMRCIIDSVNRGLDTSIEKGLEIEAENLSEVITTEDFMEGISAFMEKREPKFKGR
jgi:enoyl-CoA hydratase/carnithine racemase